MFTPPGDANDSGNDRFRLAMVASGIGMAVVDMQRCWVEINPALERMLGYSAQDLIGRATAELTPPEDVELSRQALDDLVTGRVEFLDASKRYLHRNGEIVWTQANVAVMRNGDGTPLSLLVQLRDIGAERAAQEMLRANSEERAQALEASNRQLQLFADAVAHDLRAPLRSIESFSALLSDRCGEALDDTGRDHLGRIRTAATRMSGLLDALSDLSYATRTEMKPGPVDLSLLADWVVAELQDAEPERPAIIQIQPSLTGHGDERLLKLMLTQVLGNAWKFSRESPQLRIEVAGEIVDNVLHLQVRDAGSGFDMRYAHKLFEPFQRLHGPDQGGGHGLGLAIAQRIVERHQGRIRAESEPGQGATFHIELPAAEAAG